MGAGSDHHPGNAASFVLHFRELQMFSKWSTSKPKRTRIRTTPEQLAVLEASFAEQQHPEPEERCAPPVPLSLSLSFSPSLGLALSWR